MQKSRGLELQLQVPETTEEFDAALGKKDAVLAFAIDEATYRGILPKIWRTAVERIPDEFNFPRNSTTTTDDEGNETVVLEKEGDFLNRWKAQFDASERQPFVQKIADEVGFDVSKTGRTAKPSKEFMAQAEELATKVANGDSTWDRILSNIQARCPNASFPVDDEGNAEVIDVAAALQQMFKSDSLA